MRILLNSWFLLLLFLLLKGDPVMNINYSKLSSRDENLPVRGGLESHLHEKPFTSFQEEEGEEEEEEEMEKEEEEEEEEG
ncbi:hypothetical protein M8J77_008301 [Diaphorina citri]|nr:hypothetical protein M8J77_008301 [Diaphorina citri]